MESFIGFICELLLQLFGDVVLELLSRSRSPVLQAIANSIVAALVGGALSGISLAVHPAHFIRDQGARIIVLSILPIANGLLMAWIGRASLRKTRGRSSYEYFVPAFVFSVIFGGIRFIGAK